MSRLSGRRPGTDALRQWQTLQLSKIELELQQQALSRLQQNSDEERAGHALYEMLFQQSPACSYALDEGGRVVCANQAGAALLSRSAGDLKGQCFERYLAPDEQPRWRAFSAALRSGSGRAGPAWCRSCSPGCRAPVPCALKRGSIRPPVCAVW
jgi:PAS domain-containing protein